jgi:hypothetical protein
LGAKSGFWKLTNFYFHPELKVGSSRSHAWGPFVTLIAVELDPF